MSEPSLSIALDALGDNDRIIARVVDQMLGGPNPGVDRSRTALFSEVRQVIYALATVVDEEGMPS